jgi:hypothetical protein
VEDRASVQPLLHCAPEVADRDWQVLAIQTCAKLSRRYINTVQGSTGAHVVRTECIRPICNSAALSPMTTLPRDMGSVHSAVFEPTVRCLLSMSGHNPMQDKMDSLLHRID